MNGNQVINSTSKTTEIPLNLTVNTNNKTGYTATLNSETNETALVNVGSTSGVKIDSISNDLSLSNLPNNTWGYKFGTSTNYAPIPALSTPAQILQTAGKTYGNESNQLSIGMKLSDNLESGRYTNKLIFSILTNNYGPIALMTEGLDFNNKLRSLETATNKIEHFKKSPTPPAITVNTKNIEDENSDYEIKLWLDPTDKTAYYYAEPEKVYLNEDSSKMFIYNWSERKLQNILDIDLSSFNTSKVTNMEYMFNDMPGLTSLNLSNFDTSKVTDMRDMFSDMHSLTSLDLSNFDTSQVTDMCQMFDGLSNLTSLDVSNFDTSKVTDIGAMFAGLSKLTTLNVSNFDTSKATTMYHMFSDMHNLTTLNVSNFDTSKVTNMDSMFDNLSNLTTLNVSNFDTSKVTNMDSMFSGLSKLTTLNVSNFDTSKVTTMRGMFSSMPNLTTLNVSNFDTSKVTNMDYMFYSMPNLTTLNVSNFDTSKVTSMGFMFALADAEKLKDKLETIYVNNDFNTANLTWAFQMFGNRKKLRGGNGSYLADPSTADKTWLRVDRPGAHGYFTRKP